MLYRKISFNCQFGFEANKAFEWVNYSQMVNYLKKVDAVSSFIHIQETSKIKITCPLGFVVRVEDLRRVIQKFENAENFFWKSHWWTVLKNMTSTLFNWKMYGTIAKPLRLKSYVLNFFSYEFSRQELRQYLIQMNLRHLIAKSDKSEILSNTERCQVIRVTANMMLTKYGAYPSRMQQISTAKSLHYIFAQWNEVILPSFLQYFHPH